MKYFILFLMVSAGVYLQYSMDKEAKGKYLIQGCIKGWQRSAARYKSFEKVSVEQIKKDARETCNNWWLE